MDIFENGRKIGTIEQQSEGLYTRLICQTEPSRTIRRLYLVYPYASAYLGIPDETGRLERRIVSKKLPQEYCAVCAQKMPGDYLPWRGIVDGIEVNEALIGNDEILLSQEDAMNFPSWSFEAKIIDDRQMAVLPLNAEGVPQPREREARDEALDFDDFDDGVSSGLPADDGAGREPEADCPDV